MSFRDTIVGVSGVTTLLFILLYLSLLLSTNTVHLMRHPSCFCVYPVVTGIIRLFNSSEID